jgi:uncharacterized integral membrane protein
MTAEPKHRRRARLHGLGWWWTFAVALVLGGVVIVAIAQNSHTVRVHYVVWQTRVSLIVVVLTTALAAILLDEVGGLIWRRRRRARIARRNELSELRTQRRLPDESASGETVVPLAPVGAPPAPNSDSHI